MTSAGCGVRGAKCEVRGAKCMNQKLDINTSDIMLTSTNTFDKFDVNKRPGDNKPNGREF